MKSTKLILGREPAFWSSLVMAVVAAVAAFAVTIDTETQGLIQAFVNATLGAVVAATVRPISIAAFVAVVQTALPLLVAFGLDLSTAQQGVLLTLAPLILNMILRPQVTPKMKPAVTGEGEDLDVPRGLFPEAGELPYRPSATNTQDG